MSRHGGNKPKHGGKKHGGKKHGGRKHGGGQGRGGQGGRNPQQGTKPPKNEFSISDFLKQTPPGVNLSRKQRRKEVSAATRLQFGPEQRQLEAEQRASKGRVGEISDWFDQYRKQLSMLQYGSAKAYAQPKQDIAKAGAAASSASDTLRNKLNMQEAISAKQRGATTSPMNSRVEAAGSAIRSNTADVFRNVLNAQGKAETSNLRAKKDIANRSKVDQMLREAARGRSIDADLRDLASRKGAFKTQYMSDKSQQAQDFYLGLLQAQLGKQASKRTAKTARQSQKQSAKNLRYTQKQENKRARKSLRVQLQNNRMDFRASMKSLRAQLKNNQISHAEFLQTQRGLMRRARMTDQRLREQWNRSHTKSGKSKGTVSSGGGSSGGRGENRPGKHNDPVHVQQMASFLRANEKYADKHSKSEIIQGLMAQSTTYTRPEALAAYSRWKKSRKKHQKKHKGGGGGRNVTSGFGHGGGVSGGAGTSG